MQKFWPGSNVRSHLLRVYIPSEHIPFCSLAFSWKSQSSLFIANKYLLLKLMSQEKGGTLPKFGDWDVNDPTSSEGFTVIFNKARDEKKTGGKSESPTTTDPGFKHATATVKHPQSRNWFCCVQAPHAEP
ncbi:hypothetical protein L1887_25737 [Cichorium endivia]|nr:hypothetical protein L1887_25737 [Cichorium endivia]